MKPKSSILVIDDDPVLRMVLQKTLVDQGYTVQIAKTGEEGLSQAQQQRPSLIICDWLMGGMDGLEVCRRVKSDPALANTFFILLTSRTAVVDRVKGLDTGADEFLAKPIETNELKARVRAGLRLHQTNQRLHQLAQDLQSQQAIFEAELLEAADYITSLLPAPMQEPIAINARFLPSSQLGGDCFDYYWLDSNHLVLYLLDMVGHGLGAALPSVAVQNFLRSRSSSYIDFYRPSAVLTSLNHAFPMTERSKRYFTIWYGVYNLQQRQLVYSSAGHPPAILLSPADGDVQVKSLKTRGMPIGMFAEAVYQDASCTITADDRLYVFSDGMYEFTAADQTIWGLQNLIELLKQQRDKGSQALDATLAAIQKLNGSPRFDDDCSILQIEFA